MQEANLLMHTNDVLMFRIKRESGYKVYIIQKVYSNSGATCRLNWFAKYFKDNTDDKYMDWMDSLSKFTQSYYYHQPLNSLSPIHLCGEYFVELDYHENSAANYNYTLYKVLGEEELYLVRVYHTGPLDIENSLMKAPFTSKITPGDQSLSFVLYNNKEGLLRIGGGGKIDVINLKGIIDNAVISHKAEGGESYYFHNVDGNVNVQTDHHGSFYSVSTDKTNVYNNAIETCVVNFDKFSSRELLLYIDSLDIGKLELYNSRSAEVYGNYRILTPDMEKYINVYSINGYRYFPKQEKRCLYISTNIGHYIVLSDIAVFDKYLKYYIYNNLITGIDKNDVLSSRTLFHEWLATYCFDANRQEYEKFIPKK